jgi:Baseplate J-like protein
VIAPPNVDGRRVERFVRALHAFAPHYTPDLDLSDPQSAGAALMGIFAHLAESITVRLDRAPQKHFVAFLDALGVVPVPARAARAAVTFKLANGLTTAVTVPAGTRVTAAGVDDEIPFETTNELIAIPGVLSAMYGVEPAQDAIFRPPPGFLEQKPKATTALAYRVVSFVGSGADRLQLDHVTDLQPGAFVRIDCREKHVVRKVDEGNIVTLEEGLARDATANVIVTPIRDFEVFNGINRQEHVLYLGHSRVLTVKSEAVIRVAIVLQRTAGQPLDVGWQFWTKNEKAVPEEEEHWHDLVLRSDGTNGFTSSGEVVLAKPADLEIKPRKVDERESVWIRARLLQSLPIGGATLPEIDSLQISVDAPADGIPADQGFYNATPVDVQVDPDVGFFPFGTEPRQFDQFYVASKEAFSKPEAEISLNVELDLQTLAAPSVATSTVGVHAYSVGLRRKLYELRLDKQTWRSLGSPADSPQISYVPVEDTVPSAISSAAGDKLYVFVTTEDSTVSEDTPSKVWLHSHETGQATGDWKDLGTPSAQVRLSPAAVRLPGGSTFARVFVVAVDGHLYSRGVSAAAAAEGDWASHDAPTGVTLSSPPFVVALSQDVLVFATGTDADGKSVVHRLTLRPDQTFDWLSLPPTTTPFKAVSRPFAQAFGTGSDAKVFVLGLAGADEVWKLFECNTADVTSGGVEWKDLGWPSRQDQTTTTGAVHPEAHAPCGYVDDAAAAFNREGKHIFVRDVDNRLYERLDNDPATGSRRWEDRMRPGDPNLRESPALAVESSRTAVTLHLFAATGRNSVVKWTFESRRGVLQPDIAVQLDPEAASGTDDFYNHQQLDIVGGTGTGQSEEVSAYDGRLRLARLAAPLATTPDATSEIEINNEALGFAEPGASRLLALHAATTSPPTLTVLTLRLDDDFSALPEFYSPRTGVVSLETGAPGVTSYSLYSIVSDTTNEFQLLEDSTLFPQLSWEYWNGRGWLSLKVTGDTTRNLLANGAVQFQVPRTIEPTEVAGQANFWIRARLIGGDYGRETFRIDANNVVVSEKTSLRPPKISRLRVVYQAPAALLEACLTFNNLNYLDQTAASHIGAAHFLPFQRLDDETRTLFFGFDAAFKSGPIRLLLDAAERDVDPATPPAFRWQFRKDHEWRDLAADDESQALTRQGGLTLSAADELTRETFFGRSLFWIKAALRNDRGSSATNYPNPLLRGVFLNTVWAVQGETLTDEIVASSDGEPGQRHSLQHQNVLRDEDVRIREALSVEEREQILQIEGADSIADREDIGGPWVRWKEVRAFFDAGPKDRCYSIDRAAGVLRFGDGLHGSIPPAGIDNIRAFRYRTGGGAAGNVSAGDVTTLATAVQGIESVFNPTAAGGGADTASTDTMLEIGPQQISHRDRAVSAEDFEKLAVEASRQVAKARCLRTTNLLRATNQPDPCDPGQQHVAREARGWVSVIIVPKSGDPQPCPSLELRRTVLAYLRERAPGLLVAGERLVVRPPDYVVVSISASVFVASLEQASAVEAAAVDALRKLLHPLVGGPEGRGWEFGRPIAASDVFAVLEAIRDVDHVEGLVFHVDGRVDQSAGVEIGPNELLAGGKHVLNIKRQVT